MEYIVYKVTNDLNSKVYIGQTTETLKKRWKRHCGYQLNDNTHFHRALKKYGVEHFKIEIIDVATNQAELNQKEYYWIKQYDATNTEKGYNTKDCEGKCGGDTLSSHPHKYEIAERLSKSKLGSKNPNSTKIVAINTITHSEKIYGSMKECQKDLNIPRHDIIHRRCSGEIKKLYNNEWTFKYLD